MNSNESFKKYKIKYFSGETAVAHKAFAVLQDHKLIIQDESSVKIDEWIILDIQFDPQHLDHQFLMVRHETSARIQLVDQDLVLQMPHLKHSSAHQFLSSKRFFIFALVGVILFFTGCFFAIKPLSHFIALKISPELEQKIAKKFKYENYFKICANTQIKLGTKTEDWSQDLKKKFPQIEDVIGDFKSIQVIKYPMPNAFALPGGDIFITDEFLKNAKSYEEIIGVIAHEKGHVYHRHPLESLIQGSFFGLFTVLLTNDISSALTMNPSVLMGLLNLKFDRDLEAEADDFAMQSLKKMNISSLGLVEFFERVAKPIAKTKILMESKNKSQDTTQNTSATIQSTDSTTFIVKLNEKIPEFLSTHPSDKKRIDKLKEFVLDSKLVVLPAGYSNYQCD